MLAEAKGGLNRLTETKAAKHKAKALITPLVEAKGEPEVLTRKRVDRQDPIFPYSWRRKGENIQTNLKEFTEQLAFASGFEFGNGFNYVRLGEYFTYEDKPYRDTTNTHWLNLTSRLLIRQAPSKRAHCAKGELTLSSGTRPRATLPSEPKTSADWKTTSWKLACDTNAVKT